MKDNAVGQSFLVEILIIIIASFFLTLLMGYLNAFERLSLFLQTHKLFTLTNVAVFLPSFVAMGFVLSAFHKIEQLQKGLKSTKELQNRLIESDDKYKQLSITDDLTQLYNSRHFYHQLKLEIDRAVRYNRPLSLAIMDIDDFKYHNDTFGHLEGDNVLSSLGKVINDALRGVDTGFRYGGEEFAIILPDTDLKGAESVAERIRTGFEALTFLQASDKEIHCTLSAGVTQFEPQLELKAFVNKADQAMYWAKKQGKTELLL